MLLPAAVIALGLGGLPLTGGSLAKLAVKEPLGDGVAAYRSRCSPPIAIDPADAALPAPSCSERAPDAEAAAPAGLSWPWLATAGGLRSRFPGRCIWHSRSAPCRTRSVPRRCGPALWPVLIGGVLAIGLARSASGCRACPRAMWGCARIAPARVAVGWGVGGRARRRLPATISGRRAVAAAAGDTVRRCDDCEALSYARLRFVLSRRWIPIWPGAGRS